MNAIRQMSVFELKDRMDNKDDFEYQVNTKYFAAFKSEMY